MWHFGLWQDRSDTYCQPWIYRRGSQKNQGGKGLRLQIRRSWWGRRADYVGNNAAFYCEVHAILSEPNLAALGRVTRRARIRALRSPIIWEVAKSFGLVIKLTVHSLYYI